MKTHIYTVAHLVRVHLRGQDDAVTVHDSATTFSIIYLTA